MATYSLKPLGTEEIAEVGVERGSGSSFSIRFAGATFEVRCDFDGPYRGWLRVDGRSLPYFVYRKNDSLAVWIDGNIHCLEVIERTAQRSTSRTVAARRDDLPAPMPGTILRINVKPHDRFEGHAPLIVMESMKMEMTLSAPHAGRVKEIKCRPGQLVEMGAVLMTFADEPNAAVS